MKKLLYGKEAQNKLFEGLDAVQKAVSATLGPGGKNALIEVRGRPPYITKDGATVAKHIQLSDNIADQGAQLLRTISEKAAINVGDGTTTATIIAHSIVKEGLKIIEKGKASASEVCEELLRKQELYINLLDELTFSLDKDEILSIAKMSVNGDEQMAQMIAETFSTGDPETACVIEDNTNMVDELEVVHGYQWGRGYMARQFVNQASTMRTVFQRPRILVTTEELTNPGLMIPIMMLANGMDLQTGQPKQGVAPAPLVIVAPDVNGNALETLIKNNEMGNVQLCVVKAPGYASNRNDLLEDIAAFTGARIITRNDLQRMKDVTTEDLGVCDKAIIESNKTSLLGSSSEFLAERLEEVRCLKEQASHKYQREDLEERISKLKGRIVSLRVGAQSDIEATEKKDRYEDAIYAVKSALKHGYVLGGGVTQMKLAMSGQMKSDSSRLLSNALKKQVEILFSNTDRLKHFKELSAFYSQPNRLGYKLGFNLRHSNSRISNLQTSGIIEPREILEMSIKHGVSLASAVLRTGTLIVWDDEELNGQRRK